MRIIPAYILLAGLPAASFVYSQPVDVTQQVGVTQTTPIPSRTDRSDLSWTSLVTVTSPSLGADRRDRRNGVPGPIGIALTGLPEGVPVVNSSGTVNSLPFITVSDAAIQPGESVSAIVEFLNPTNVPVIFGVQVLSGVAIELSAFGTAVVDGVRSPGEWDGAAQLNFRASVPETLGGGAAPAVLYVMNDAGNLYLAVRVAHDGLAPASVRVQFSNDNSTKDTRGGLKNGDDTLSLVEAYWSLPRAFNDLSLFTGFPCPPDFNLGCLYGDDEFGGTVDGAGDARFDGSSRFYEISHPLNSADNLYDFSLFPGSRVGFQVVVWLCAEVDPAGGVRECRATVAPGPAPLSPLDRGGFGVIVIQ